MRLPIQLFVILAIVQASVGLKILLLLPFPGPSHFLMFKVYIKELLSRGHEITAITAFQYGEEVQNYTEIFINPSWSFGNSFSQEKIFDMKFSSQLDMLHAYWSMGLGSTEHALNADNIKDFIKNDKTKFDLIFAEQFFQEALLMFAHKYKVPVVTLSTYGYSDFMDTLMGSITPYSFVPHMVLYDYSDDMTFFQRCHNLLFSMYDVAMRKFYYLPKMDKMAREHFSSLPQPLPSTADLEKSSVSVVLVNSHFGLFHPRPNMPGLVNVAGSHIKPIKPLPSDIQKFMDEAEHGIIYFSLGAFVRSANIPKGKMETILKVFGSLKQRVLWKFEIDEKPELPANVMMQKWLPQSDILGHHNVKLFISHGGLFGTIEGSFRGVPILILPFYGDQYRNAKVVTDKGFGDRILFSDVTETSLKLKLNEMLSNPKYQTKARQMSKVLNDKMQSPLDVAIYWIEYVAKFDGAQHLKSPATKLGWFKYLSLDVFTLIALIMLVVWKSLRLVCCKMFAKRSDDKRKVE